MGEGALTPRCWVALETATRRASVALWRDGALLAERDDDSGRPHSECLLPALAGLLADAGLAAADVDGWAVSIGPGSFTGLRIGLATLKGLVFGDGRPVAAVPTLAALALAAAPEGAGPVVALLDARRGEVYAAGYPEPGAVVPGVLAEGVYTPAALAARLPDGARLVVGEGSEAAAAALAAERPGAFRALAPERCLARAAWVAALAPACLAAGLAAPAAALVPRYLRRAEAEARRVGEPLEEPPGPV